MNAILDTSLEDIATINGLDLADLTAFLGETLPAGGGPVLLDDFNRANSSDLGANWTHVNALGGSSANWHIVSNQADAPNTSDLSDAWIADIFPTNQEITVTLKAATDVNTSQLWLLAQMPDPSAGTFTGYLVGIIFGSPSGGHINITIYRGDGGSFANLGSSNVVYSIGDTFTFRKTAARVEFLQNGTLVFFANDTTSPATILVPGYIGIGATGDAALAVDDFAGGEYLPTTISTLGYDSSSWSSEFYNDPDSIIASGFFTVSPTDIYITQGHLYISSKDAGTWTQKFRLLVMSDNGSSFPNANAGDILAQSDEITITNATPLGWVTVPFSNHELLPPLAGVWICLWAGPTTGTGRPKIGMSNVGATPEEQRFDQSTTYASTGPFSGTITWLDSTITSWLHYLDMQAAVP